MIGTIQTVAGATNDEKRASPALGGRRSWRPFGSGVDCLSPGPSTTVAQTESVFGGCSSPPPRHRRERGAKSGAEVYGAAAELPPTPRPGGACHLRPPRRRRGFAKGRRCAARADARLRARGSGWPQDGEGAASPSPAEYGNDAGVRGISRTSDAVVRGADTQSLANGHQDVHHDDDSPRRRGRGSPRSPGRIDATQQVVAGDRVEEHGPAAVRRGQAFVRVEAANAAESSRRVLRRRADGGSRAR
jgi:hypothetical protein